MKISIGSDHAGYELKEKIKHFLKEKGIESEDFGTYSEESCDYPDYAHAVANNIEQGNTELGILICGSANGITIAANKHQGIRAAISWTPEIAELARLHNNANILSLPARFITEKEALNIVEVFFNTEFEGERHEKRVNKIAI